MASFGLDFERDILAQAARDPRYRESARRLLEEHSFTSAKHGWLWKVVSKLAYSDRLTAALAVTAANKDFKDEEERDEHLRVAVQVLKHEPPAAAASLKELGDFLRYHRLSGSIQKAIKALDKSDVNAAGEALADAVRFRPGTTYERSDWIEDFDTRQARRKELSEHPERKLVVPCKFSRVDKLLSGGIEAGELGLVVGNTGRGKSAVAVHLGFWAAVHGFSVAHISTEMKVEPVATRYDAKMLAIPYTQLKEYSHSPSDLELISAKLAKLSAKLAKRLRIVSTPIRQATLATVEQVLDDLAAEGRSVQLLIVDSGDHLKPSERHREHRVEAANVYWDMKSIAVERDIAVWTTTQASKEVVSKIATAENVSDAYDKARIADILITLNQTKAEERLGKLKLYLAKNRQGRAKALIPLVADLARMHIEEDEEPEEKAEEESDGE